MGALFPQQVKGVAGFQVVAEGDTVRIQSVWSSADGFNCRR